MWDEFFHSLLSDKPQIAQVSETMSRVERADTCLALDTDGDTTKFDSQMNDEDEKALNWLKKSNLTGVKTKKPVANSIVSSKQFTSSYFLSFFESLMHANDSHPL